MVTFPKEQAAELAPILLQRLLAARERAGLSQADATRLLGITKGGARWLAKIEAGSIEAPTWIVVRACRVYGVSADYLMGSADSPRPKRTMPAPIVESACRDLIREPVRRRADADALIDSARHLQKLRRLTEAVAPLADELAGAQADVESQEAWQDVRGGSRWATSSGKAAELLTRARQLALL